MQQRFQVSTDWQVIDIISNEGDKVLDFEKHVGIGIQHMEEAYQSDKWSFGFSIDFAISLNRENGDFGGTAVNKTDQPGGGKMDLATGADYDLVHRAAEKAKKEELFQTFKTYSTKIPPRSALRIRQKMVNFDAAIDIEDFFYASSQILFEHIGLDEIESPVETITRPISIGTYELQNQTFTHINPGLYYIANSFGSIDVSAGFIQMVQFINNKPGNENLWMIEKDSRTDAYYITNTEYKGCKLRASENIVISCTENGERLDNRNLWLFSNYNGDDFKILNYAQFLGGRIVGAETSEQPDYLQPVEVPLNEMPLSDSQQAYFNNREDIEMTMGITTIGSLPPVNGTHEANRIWTLVPRFANIETFWKEWPC